MPQISQVLRECVIGMLSWGMSTRAVARELNLHFSTISLQHSFIEFGSTPNKPNNHRLHVWRHVRERFADVNIVNTVPHGGGGVMLWAVISSGWRTQLHFIDGNLNTQRYIDEILKPIVVPFIRRHHLLFQNDDALPRVARNYTENVPVVPWPAYSPGMSLIERVTFWDALDHVCSVYNCRYSYSLYMS